MDARTRATKRPGPSTLVAIGVLDAVCPAEKRLRLGGVASHAIGRFGVFPQGGLSSAHPMTSPALLFLLPGVRSRCKSGCMSRLAWWPPRRNTRNARLGETVRLVRAARRRLQFGPGAPGCGTDRRGPCLAIGSGRGRLAAPRGTCSADGMPDVCSGEPCGRRPAAPPWQPARNCSKSPFLPGFAGDSPRWIFAFSSTRSGSCWPWVST